jgi:hypothetical protein
MAFDRQVLFGFGLGLLVAAILFAAGGGRRPVSEIELIRRAKALGMTFPGEQRLTLEAVEPKAPLATQAPAPPAAPAQAPAAARMPTPTPTPARRPSQVTVVVPPGATAGEVARLLRAKSLIADEAEFLRLASTGQAEARFLPGQYRFRRDIAVRDLIATLVSGPPAR